VFDRQRKYADAAADIRRAVKNFLLPSQPGRADAGLEELTEEEADALITQMERGWGQQQTGALFRLDSALFLRSAPPEALVERANFLVGALVGLLEPGRSWANVFWWIVLEPPPDLREEAQRIVNRLLRFPEFHRPFASNPGLIPNTLRNFALGKGFLAHDAGVTLETLARIDMFDDALQRQIPSLVMFLISDDPVLSANARDLLLKMYAKPVFQRAIDLEIPAARRVLGIREFEESIQPELTFSARLLALNAELAASGAYVSDILHIGMTSLGGLEQTPEVAPVDFLEVFGSRLNDEQRRLAQEYIDQGGLQVTIVRVPETFHLYADSTLATIAGRRLAEEPVEGFRIAADLRVRPRDDGSFRAPGLITADPLLGDFEWAGSPVRILPVTTPQMQGLSPLALLALAVNQNLSVEQVLNLRSITFTDERNRTIHAIFA
jgi:hypothetical protein